MDLEEKRYIINVSLLYVILIKLKVRNVKCNESNGKR